MVVRRAKRTQHCTFCKNHGLNVPKKGHQCDYSGCTCLLCKLTQKAQVAMRHQQRVWRHQKLKLKNQSGEEESSTVPGEKPPSKGQACDKCRNHNIIKPKRNHECPFNGCDCEYCSLTFKRREIMKHQQRVRRSRIMSQVESESSGSPVEKSVEEDEDDHEEDSDDKMCYEDSQNVDEESNSSPRNSPPAVLKIDLASPERPSSQVHLHEMEDIKEVEPLQNLSIQFSSLESEYPLSPEIHSKIETRDSTPDESLFVNSPPPLLPIDIGSPCYNEEGLSRSKSVNTQYPYGYPAEGYSSAQRGEMYQERMNFPQEAPLLESSQISTVMLFQNGYSSSDPHAFSSPQHLQQSSSAFKISVDQLVQPPATCGQFDDFSSRNQNRYHNHAGLGPSFSNFSQTSAMYLHEQRQYQFQRRQREHQIRLLPYFHFSESNP